MRKIVKGRRRERGIEKVAELTEMKKARGILKAFHAPNKYKEKDGEGDIERKNVRKN